MFFVCLFVFAFVFVFFYYVENVHRQSVFIQTFLQACNDYEQCPDVVSYPDPPLGGLIGVWVRDDVLMLIHASYNWGMKTGQNVRQDIFPQEQIFGGAATKF